MITDSRPIWDASLAEILSQPATPGTRASATDIPGVNLEWMATDTYPAGAWFGDCGQPTLAQLYALPTTYLAFGARASVNGAQYTYGAAGWWRANNAGELDKIVSAMRARFVKLSYPNIPYASAPADNVPTITYVASAPTSTHPVNLYPAGSQISGDATESQKISMMEWIRGFSPRLRNYIQGDILRLNSSLYNTASGGNGGTDSVVDPGVVWGIDSAVTTWDYSFYGASLSFPVRNTSKFDICVDDDMVNASSLTGGNVVAKGDGCGYVVTADGYITLTFPSSATRRIRLRFSGIYTPSRMMFPRLSTVMKSPKSPVWLHIGDSYTANGPMTASAPTVQESGRGMMQYLREMASGSANIINIATGGASFSHAAQVFPESTKPYNTSYRASFRKAFQLAGKGLDAKIVTILGGYNDIANSAHTLPAFSENILKLIDEVQQEYPLAKIFVIGVNCGPAMIGTGSPIVAENAMKAAVALTDATMVPLQTADTPFITGTGSDAAPTGDGNADYMVYNDHPTPKATPIWARLIADAIS